MQMLTQQYHKATTLISEHVTDSKTYFNIIFENELTVKDYRKHPICFEDYLLMLAVSSDRAKYLQQKLTHYKQSINILQDPLQVTAIIDVNRNQDNEFLNMSKNNLLYGIQNHQIGESHLDDLAFDDPNEQNQYLLLKEQINKRLENVADANQLVEDTASRYCQTLVCALYNSESLEQVEEFIKGHQNSTIVIVVNTHCQLKQDLKEKLFKDFQGHPVLSSDQDINLKDAIFVLQFTVDKTNILFFITYQQQAHHQLISLAYDQIASHFDPKYLWMTQVSIKAINVISELIKSVSEKEILGVCPQVKSDLDSLNFLNIRSGLWFETQKKLQNSDFVNYNHDMWYCFYDWQKMKQILKLKFEEADTDIEFSNISQSPNFLFPNIALLMNQNINEPNSLLFKIKQIPVYSGLGEVTSSISTLIDQIRKQENSKYYQSMQFYQFSEMILRVLSNRNCYNYLWNWIQIQYLNLKALIYVTTHDIKLSIIVYLAFDCCFQLVYNFDQINTDIQDIIGLIFPIVIVIVVLFFVAFSITFNLKYLYSSGATLSIDGILYFYASPNGTLCKIIIQDSKNRELQPKIHISNQSLLITILHDQKFYELKNRELLRMIQQQAQDRLEQIFKLKGSFMFREQSQPASNLIVRIFQLGGTINALLLIAFVLNIVYSYLVPDFTAINIIVLISLAICIICTLVECVISQQKYYIIGLLSYILYYIPLQLGLQIYSMFNIDSAQDGSLLSQFYYQKIFKVSKILVLNYVLMFGYVMIERAFGYQGYILIGLIIYKALESICTLKSNFYQCLKRKKSQNADKPYQDPGTTDKFNEQLLTFNEAAYLQQLSPQRQQGGLPPIQEVQEEVPGQGRIQYPYNGQQVEGGVQLPPGQVDDQGALLVVRQILGQQPQDDNQQFNQQLNNQQPRNDQQQRPKKTIKLKSISIIDQTNQPQLTKHYPSSGIQHQPVKNQQPPSQQEQYTNQFQPLESNYDPPLQSQGSSTSPLNRGKFDQTEYQQIVSQSDVAQINSRAEKITPSNISIQVQSYGQFNVNEEQYSPEPINSKADMNSMLNQLQNCRSKK